MRTSITKCSLAVGMLMVASGLAGLGMQAEASSPDPSPSADPRQVSKGIPSARPLPAVTTVTLPPSPAASPATIDPDSAMALDAATLAKAHGISDEQAAIHTAGLESFDAALIRVEEAYPDTVIKYGINDDGSYWIEVGTIEPEKIADALGDLPYPVTVTRRVNARPSEIDALQTDAMSTAAESTWGASSSTYDARNAILLLNIDAADEPARVRAEEQVVADLSSIASDYPDGRIPVPVRLESRVDATDIPRAAGYRGGRGLRLSPTGAVQCTAGFIVNRNGRDGLVTAQHCANNLLYGGQNVMTYVTAATNAGTSRIDLQYHRFDLGSDVDPYFRATGTTASDDRSVDSIANAPMNSTICKFGMNSGYSCDIIEDINECTNMVLPDGVTIWHVCGLDITNNNNVVGGDSGGPWFVTHTAKGITSAFSATADYLTRIGRLGVHIPGAVVMKE